jgi:hypothetical protein
MQQSTGDFCNDSVIYCSDMLYVYEHDTVWSSADLYGDPYRVQPDNVVMSLGKIAIWSSGTRGMKVIFPSGLVAYAFTKHMRML